MPCDSIVTNTIDLDLANEDVLRAAIQQHLGGIFTSKSNFVVDGQRYGIQDGKLTGDSRNVGEMADRIKQAYSREVVDRAAKRFGWRTQKAGNKITLRRG